MGLLGGSEDSLSGSSGWGVLPPINTTTEWGSSSSSSSTTANIVQNSGNNTSTISSSQSNQVSSANSGNSHWQVNNVRQTITASSTSNSVEQSNNNNTLSSTVTKPLSSWAQAAGKGLNNSNNSAAAVVVSASASNGPNISNSHDSYSNQNAAAAAAKNNANNSSSQNGVGALGTTIAGNAFQSSNTVNNGATSVNTSSCNASGKMRTPFNDITLLSDELHESLLTEKWGSTVINHESPWNLPPSPQTSPKDPSAWRCQVNSGTEIWESTVRQKKGLAPGVNAAVAVAGSTNAAAAAASGAAPMSQANSWDQPPSTYIGGTWGEEENSNNHWTGVPQSINLVSGGTSTSINNWSAGMSSNGATSGNPSNIITSKNLNAANIVGSKNINQNSIAVALPVTAVVNNVNNTNTTMANTGSSVLNSNSWNGVDSAAAAAAVVAKSAINESRPKAALANWENSAEAAAAQNAGADWENFGTWDKDSMDGSKSTIDGTAVWGNVVRQSSKVSNWKDTKNQNNSNKNGWNNDATNNGGNKMANQMLNRTWTDASGHRKSPSLWTEETKNLNGLAPGAGVASNIASNNWSDGQVDTSNWSDKKPMPREAILNSKKFRLLLDMGFKKENVESALRNHQMRLGDAMNELSKVEGSPNPKARLSDNLPNSIPHLAQSIQRAVSVGYINPHVLNQQFSSQNLELLSELLNQITTLQNLQSQQNNGANSDAQQMKINQIKQSIGNLQNQLQMVNQQQQQQQQPNSLLGNSGDGNGNKGIHVPQQPNEFIKANNDTAGPMYGGGGNGGIGEFSASRLHNWKNNQQRLNSFSKSDENKLNNDFVRAPGPISKQSSTPANNWGNLLADDPATGGGWANELMLKQDKSLVPPTQSLMDEYQLPDFRQDLEYKNWKINSNAAGAKGLDEDPRSPLFPWNNNKNLLGNNSNVDSLGSPFFSSNTWSYNLNSQNNSPMFSVDINKKPINPTWGNQMNSGTDYMNQDTLWNSGAAAPGSNAISKPRPPPGLSQVKNSAPSNNANSNIWNSGLSSNSSSSSEYLRLRNLTPQIDGSTLKTLCLQHGPLHLFHLFLNHGIAIARYANREQAIKAQSALNNCVLSNTTIVADIPPESELQQYLHLISGQQMSNSTTNHHALSSWSNGTNASQHNAAVAANSVIGQSSALYRNNNTVSAGTAHLSSFGNSNLVNVTSPASTLPYGGAAGGGGGVSTLTTHSSSHTLPYNANNAFNTNSTVPGNGGNSGGAKLDSWSVGGSGGAGGVSAPSSAGLWDMQNSNSGLGNTTSLWSSAGFSTADRNTPIQSFLPNDLLAGENNN